MTHRLGVRRTHTHTVLGSWSGRSVDQVAVGVCGACSPRRAEPTTRVWPHQHHVTHAKRVSGQPLNISHGGLRLCYVYRSCRALAVTCRSLFLYLLSLALSVSPITEGWPGMLGVFSSSSSSSSSSSRCSKLFQWAREQLCCHFKGPGTGACCVGFSTLTCSNPRAPPQAFGLGQRRATHAAPST